MKDLLKILLRQWTFYITLVLFVVLYFVPDGDISSKTAMCYIGLMQVFLIVFWLLRAVFMKRLPCERTTLSAAAKELERTARLNGWVPVT